MDKLGPDTCCSLTSMSREGVMIKEYTSKCYEQAEEDGWGQMADSSAGRCLVSFSVERGNIRKSLGRWVVGSSV